MQEQTLSSIDLHREPFPGLDEYIRGVVRDWSIPGLALGIVKDDRLVFAKGYGVRKLGEEKPIDEYSISAVASVTKAFTAAAVGLLVDDGKVRWDDPVIKHLPDFALYDPYVTREITIRDLLCARSGLVDGELMRYNEGFDRNEVVRRLRYLKPGAGFRTTQAVYTLNSGYLMPTWDCLSETGTPKCCKPGSSLMSGKKQCAQSTLPLWKPGASLVRIHHLRSKNTLAPMRTSIMAKRKL